MSELSYDEWLATLKPARRKSVKWAVRQLRKQGWEIRRRRGSPQEYVHVCYRQDMPQ